MCPSCKEMLSLSAFAKDSKKTSGRKSWCKKCTLQRINEARAQFKRACLEYAGGAKCSICGYDKCISALEFHHVDRYAKDFTISQCRAVRLTDNIKSELDKCVVLCANCHREAEEKLNES